VNALRIKVCGITRIDDAAVAGRADVDAVGFVLWPGSPRAVTVDQAAQLGRALPPWTVRVGVFVAVSVDAVAAAVAAAGLGAVQLHGVADPTPYLRLAVPLLWSMPLRDGQPDPVAPVEATLMLDAYDPRRHGGTGRPVDWGRAATIARRQRLVLAGGLTPDNIAEAIAIVRPYGVDVSSGIEETPGIKSAPRLLAFVEAARRSAREAQA
jgi:phosphoribosylanthranilate isomerase